MLGPTLCELCVPQPASLSCGWCATVGAPQSPPTPQTWEIGRCAWPGEPACHFHLSAVYLRLAKGPSGYPARFPWSSCATPSDLGHGCVAKGCQQCDRTRSPRIAPTKTKRAEVNGICTPMLLSELAKRGTGQTNSLPSGGASASGLCGTSEQTPGSIWRAGVICAHTGYPPPTNSSSVNCARTPCSTFALLLNLSLETWLRELPTSAEWPWASEDSPRRYVQLSARAQRYRPHTEPVLV